MPPLSRRRLLLALIGGCTTLASCGLPGASPSPSPAPRAIAAASPFIQRPGPPAGTPRPAPATPAATPALRPSDPLLRARTLIYVGEHAGRRGLIASKGDGSDTMVVAEGRYGPATWSPNGDRFLVVGAHPGEDRLAPRAWQYQAGMGLLRSHRLEGLQDLVAWAPDSLRVAVVATRRDARATPERALATYLLLFEGEIEVALGQQTQPLGWTPRGRLLLTVTDRLPGTEPEYAPRTLWTTSVAGDDRRRIAEGHTYVGLVAQDEAVYALGEHRPYQLPSRSTAELPTRLAILDIRTGQETLSIAADEIAASTSLPAPAQPPYWFASAAVSPRGDQVALWLVPHIFDPNGALPAILAVVGQDGSIRWAERVPVTPLPAAPVWSPRNDALAYTTGPLNRPDPANTPVHLRAANGRTATLPHADICNLAWSPDGAWISYNREQRLFLSAATDPNRTYLLADDGHTPRWRPR
jgi:hypothetical protein